MAWSTATVTGKDSSKLISVCCPDVMSGVVLEILVLCPLCADFLGVLSKGGRSVDISPSEKCSPWLSESTWVSAPADTSLGMEAAVRVM